MPKAAFADSIGPVDVAVIAFDGNQFNGDVAPAIAELQDNGTVRIIDLTFVFKDSDGKVAVVEAEDSAIAAAFERITKSQFDLLSDDDLASISDALEPESSAMVVVWENTWASRLGAAVRESNGRVVALDRIPRDVVLEAFQALETD
ncbi:putative membrane protein [Catenulispora sp. MAP12-49]|uniref:DUF6325 family protein n=1 Tax=Catenulispora sp. MAP12-49 TaxID=3156302 RepID=UPI003513F1F1